jgi:hypothetical protein
MSDLSDRNSFQKLSPLGRVFALSAAALVVFALNLFVLEPLLSRVLSPVASQIFYIGVRIFGMIVLAYALTRFAGRSRIQVFSTVLLVGFIDQVGLKTLWIHRDMRIHPAAWQGFEPTSASIFVNMATGYLFFIPIVLILCFLGTESTRFRKDWKLDEKELP